MLAPSVFLQSAASTHSLQQSIFPDCIKVLEDQSITATEQSQCLPNQSQNGSTFRKLRMDWWQKLTRLSYRINEASSETDRARLLAA